MGPKWLDGSIRWITGHERAVLMLTVGFQVILLVAMIIRHALPLLVGETILLKVVPVDPRDLFRGDYVILNYEISRMSPDGLNPNANDGRRNSGENVEDRPVYVSLEPDPDGKHWRGVKASWDPPSSGKYIKGKYSADAWRGGPLKFGIEAYYVEEGTGLKLEQIRNSRKLSAEIALTSWGQATLRGLRIE